MAVCMVVSTSYCPTFVLTPSPLLAYLVQSCVEEHKNARLHSRQSNQQQPHERGRKRKHVRHRRGGLTCGVGPRQYCRTCFMLHARLHTHAAEPHCMAVQLDMRAMHVFTTYCVRCYIFAVRHCDQAMKVGVVGCGDWNSICGSFPGTWLTSQVYSVSLCCLLDMHFEQFLFSGLTAATLC